MPYVVPVEDNGGGRFAPVVESRMAASFALMDELFLGKAPARSKKSAYGGGKAPATAAAAPATAAPEQITETPQPAVLPRMAATAALKREKPGELMFWAHITTLLMLPRIAVHTTMVLCILQPDG